MRIIDARPTEPRRLLFINNSAGPASSDVPECLANFERFEIADAPNVLTPLLAETSNTVPPLIAVWGGDGSIRSVAALMIHTSATLLACPGGTHNHFCRAIGNDDEASIERALQSGVVRSIDVGMADTQVFLNNLSIGWYTDLVLRRERYERVLPRRLAKVLSVVVQLARTRRLRVNVDGSSERVWAVWVGNGAYSMDPRHLLARDNLDNETLDLRILRAGTHWPKLRAMIVALRGNAESSSHIVQRQTTSTTLHFASPRVRATVDGEVIAMPARVTVKTAPGALRILVPAVQDDATMDPSGLPPKLTSGRSTPNELPTQNPLMRNASVGGLVLAALAFGLVAGMTSSKSGLASYDLPLANWSARHATPTSTAGLRVLTRLGGYQVIIAAAITVTLLEFRRGLGRSVVPLLLVVVGGQYAIVSTLKAMVGRERPDLSRLTGFASASFPSGHSTAAAASYAAFGLLLGRRRSKRSKATIAVATAAVTVAVAGTRVMLGVHWLTDVLGGLALGWAWLSVGLLVCGTDPSLRGPRRFRRMVSPKTRG